MGAAANKQLMRDIFAEMAKGNGKLFVDSLADDFRWTIAGATKWSRTYEGRQTVLTKLLRPLFSQFADTYTATAHRFIADGDHVVVEARGENLTKAGARYDNDYCLVFRLENGNIKEVREYCDSVLTEKALGPFPESRKLAAS